MAGSVYEELAAIQAKRAEVAKAELALREKEEAARKRLDALKAKCDASCAEVHELLKDTTDPADRATLEAIGVARHEDHRIELEEAYLAFANQTRSQSNPATVGENFLESHVVVSSAAGA